MERRSPLAAVVKGLVAGATGTAAMTAYQTAVAKARDSEPSTIPAEVAKRIIRGMLERDVSDEQTALLNNVMHWSYGTGWGAAYGIVACSISPRTIRSGVAFGTVVWGASLVELPAMKLAPPPWEYPPQELALDLSYHLVYGVVTAVALAALRP
jgi:hypothetical protein